MHYQLPINRTFQYKTVCVTILTSIDSNDQPVTISIRSGTNNQYDFLRFVLYCSVKRILHRGDTLVLDNAAVHRASNIRSNLDAIMNKVGCRILFMPTYSPELNPCELVFEQAKKHASYLWHTSNLSKS